MTEKKKPAQDNEQETTAEQAQDKGQEMTTEQMSEFLQAQNRLRAEQCTTEIQKILDEYKCRINSYPVIIDGRIVTQTEIVAV